MCGIRECLAGCFEKSGAQHMEGFRSGLIVEGEGLEGFKLQDLD